MKENHKDELRSQNNAWLSYLNPSFEMTVEKYVPYSRLELSGVNNWWSLLLAHGILAVVAGTLFYLFIPLFEAYLLVKLLYFFIGYQLLSFSSIRITAARNSNYMKEIVRITPNGITLSSSKKSRRFKEVNISSLQDMKVVIEEGRLKFMIYGFDRPYFEFKPVLNHSDLSSLQKFLTAIFAILDLKISREQNFHPSIILELSSKHSETEDLSKSTVDSGGNRKVDNDISKPIADPYRPKHINLKKFNGNLLVNERREPGFVPVKLEVLVDQDLMKFTYDWLLVRKVKISDITDYKISIWSRVDRNQRYIEGALYASSERTKRKEIFVLRRVITKKEQLLKLEMLKDLEYIRDTIEEIVK